MAYSSNGIILRLSYDSIDLFKTGITTSKTSLNMASKLPIYCDESVMSQKAHGTTDKPVQESLRWNCDRKTADNICCFNRHYAEYSGYWTKTTFLKEVSKSNTFLWFLGLGSFLRPKESQIHSMFLVLALSRLSSLCNVLCCNILWLSSIILINLSGCSLDWRYRGRNYILWLSYR